MATLRTIRRPAPAEFELQRWLELVSRAGRGERERIVQNVRYYRDEDGVWFSWRYSQEMVPDESESAASADATAKAAAKRNAAPTWAEINHEFGSQGARYNAAGKQIGYKYPEPRTEEERIRQNEVVYAMWKRQREISLDIGGERSARTAVTTLVDRRTGREHQVAAAHADAKARKAGLVEKSSMAPRKKARA